jgi:hypothetical protein
MPALTGSDIPQPSRPSCQLRSGARYSFPQPSSGCSALTGSLPPRCTSPSRLRR